MTQDPTTNLNSILAIGPLILFWQPDVRLHLWVSLWKWRREFWRCPARKCVVTISLIYFLWYVVSFFIYDVQLIMYLFLMPPRWQLLLQLVELPLLLLVFQLCFGDQTDINRSQVLLEIKQLKMRWLRETVVEPLILLVCGGLLTTARRVATKGSRLSIGLEESIITVLVRLATIIGHCFVHLCVCVCCSLRCDQLRFTSLRILRVGILISFWSNWLTLSINLGQYIITLVSLGQRVCIY